MHTVIWGQCSEDMKSKVKTHVGYKEKVAVHDCVWLLKPIKSVTLQFDVSRNAYLSLLVDAQESFLCCRQTHGQTIEDSVYAMQGWAETIESHGGLIIGNVALMPARDNEGNERSTEERKAIARERTLAITLIRRADTSRYGTLITSLSNDYTIGKDKYPNNVLAAQSLLFNFKTPVNTGTRRTSVATAANSTAQPLGGPAASDSAPTTSGLTLMQYAYMLAQAGDDLGIDPNWILLDSQSTIFVFRNAAMLTNIRKSDHVLQAVAKSDHHDSNMVGDFPNLGKLWYNREFIASILLLANVSKVCRVTMDLSAEPSMNVHKLDGEVMRFLEHPSGLYEFNRIMLLTML